MKQKRSSHLCLNFLAIFLSSRSFPPFRGQCCKTSLVFLGKSSQIGIKTVNWVVPILRYHRPLVVSLPRLSERYCNLPSIEENITSVKAFLVFTDDKVTGKTFYSIVPAARKPAWILSFQDSIHKSKEQRLRT